MKEGRKSEYPEKTPDDEHQRLSNGQGHARFTASFIRVFFL